MTVSHDPNKFLHILNSIYSNITLIIYESFKLARYGSITLYCARIDTVATQPHLRAGSFFNTKNYKLQF